MAEAQLRWRASTTEAEARILALKAVVDSLGGEQTTTRLRSVSNSLDKIGKDGEKAGTKLERAFKDIPKSIDNFGKGLSGPFGILKPLGLLEQLAGKVGSGIQSLGGWLTKLGQPLEQVGAEGTQAVGMFGQMAGAIGPVLAAGGPLVTVFLALGGALVVLPLLIAAVAAALTALVDVLGIAAALIAGFTGPLLTVTGLLGGLGLAFAYVAKQSFQNSASMDTQKLALEKLHIAQQTYNTDVQKYGKNATQTQSALVSLQQAQDAYAKSQVGVAISSAHLSEKFHQLIQQLTVDFTPEIVKLADAAGKALSYLDKVSKMDLTGAFKSLNTKGVHLLDKFARGVADVIAKPIRLAIKLAFGKQSNIGNVLGGWLHDISNYLTGVHGALNPFVKWFNEQHFTSTGLRWAHEVIDAIIHSSGWAGLKTAVVKIAQDAGSAFGHAFVAAAMAEIEGMIGLLGHGVGAVRATQSQQILLRYNPGAVTDPGSTPGNPTPVRGRAIKPATGGLVTGGVPGADSVPALLTPGELVLNRRQQLALLHGGTGPRVIQLHVDLGRGVKQVVQFELKQTARGLQAARAWGG